MVTASNERSGAIPFVHIWIQLHSTVAATRPRGCHTGMGGIAIDVGVKSLLYIAMVFCWIGEESW